MSKYLSPFTILRTKKGDKKSVDFFLQVSATNTNERAEKIFTLIVTNEQGTASEPDEVKITVNPTRSIISEDDASRTLSDEITGIIKNPLNITNSIDSADRLRDVLTHNTLKQLETMRPVALQDDISPFGHHHKIMIH